MSKFEKWIHRIVIIAVAAYEFVKIVIEQLAG